MRRFLGHFDTVTPLLVLSIIATPMAVGCGREVAPAPEALGPPAPERLASPEQMEGLLKYIKTSWRVLRRSNADLARGAVDPKHDKQLTRWPVYISQKENLRTVQRRLREQLDPEGYARIEVKKLPAAGPMPSHGILYLPHPYVVPGGRFNEMYGWDSYFIELGLLQDGELTLAQNMVDNFIYQIDHYGTILNANRTYYLTRSEPPFLTQMLLAVHAQNHDDRWLLGGLAAVEKYYQYWTTGAHLSSNGLSRYFDLGTGPAPEVQTGERDAAGRTHYERVKTYYRDHRSLADYDLKRFYDAESDQLTDLFYVADRSMRESGFDPSNRFGPFNIAVIDYNPVCLNVLLYAMELEAAQITDTLMHSGDPAVRASLEGVTSSAWWRDAAMRRAALINRTMWDEEAGLYFDYNFTNGTRRGYAFNTTFFPLWAGLASRHQAARVVHNLALFERRGGLQVSAYSSGSQWDSPFGWAPLNLIAFKGMQHYGYDVEANRIGVNFLSTVLKGYVNHGAIFEKYDVTNRESQVGADLQFGYTSNEVGFGWTNGAFLEMYEALPQEERDRVRRLDGVGLGDIYYP